MTESSSVLHVHPLSVNWEVKRLGGFGEPRPKKEKKKKDSRHGYSSTQRATLWRPRLSREIKHGPCVGLPKPRAAHSRQEPAFYFCFPSGHRVKKEHFWEASSYAMSGG